MSVEKLPDTAHQTGQLPREPMDFCHEPSDEYLDVLEECGDDPRSAAATVVNRWSQRVGGAFVSDPDSRMPGAGTGFRRKSQ